MLKYQTARTPRRRWIKKEPSGRDQCLSSTPKCFLEEGESRRSRELPLPLLPTETIMTECSVKWKEWLSSKSYENSTKSGPQNKHCSGFDPSGDLVGSNVSLRVVGLSRLSIFSRQILKKVLQKKTWRLLYAKVYQKPWVSQRIFLKAILPTSDVGW